MRLGRAGIPESSSCHGRRARVRPSPPDSSLHAREAVLDDDGKLAALAVLIAHAITGLERNPGARLRRTLGAALRNPDAVEHGVQIGAVGLDFEGWCLRSVIARHGAGSNPEPGSWRPSASLSCFRRPNSCRAVPSTRGRHFPVNPRRALSQATGEAHGSRSPSAEHPRARPAILRRQRHGLGARRR